MSSKPSPSLACGRVRVLLEPYVDGDFAENDPQLAAAVHEHLQGCADCRRQHHQAVSVPFRLKALGSPQPRPELAANVMKAIAPEKTGYRRAWTLLAPEAILAAFILWYLSGLEGLSSIASGVAADLQALAGWGSGAGDLPVVPGVDVLLLLALISLTALTGYHLSVLVNLAPGGALPARRTARD
jgi:predicted anti-sigma-YlaC factor YlaD